MVQLNRTYGANASHLWCYFKVAKHMQNQTVDPKVLCPKFSANICLEGNTHRQPM